MLRTVARKTSWGYKGYVVMVAGEKKLWSEVAGPHRLCRADALEDAERLKKDRENTWME